VQSVPPTRIVSRPPFAQRYNVDGLTFFPPRRRGRWCGAAVRVRIVSLDKSIMFALHHLHVAATTGHRTQVMLATENRMAIGGNIGKKSDEYRIAMEGSRGRVVEGIGNDRSSQVLIKVCEISFAPYTR
jgi:hypothetical protein